MKKILLFLAILPSILFAQIGQIQTTGKQYENVGRHMIRYIATNQYELLMRSNNPYEDKTVLLSLGTGPTEAATSLSHLYAIFNDYGQSFNLQGYSFSIEDRKKICAQVAYAAGELCISKSELTDEILTLIMDKGADYGELAVSQGYAPTGDYLLSFDTYGFTEFVRINKDISAQMSRTYNDFDELSKEDVQVLRKAIRENYTSVTHALLGLTVCGVILGEDK